MAGYAGSYRNLADLLFQHCAGRYQSAMGRSGNYLKKLAYRNFQSVGNFNKRSDREVCPAFFNSDNIVVFDFQFIGKFLKRQFLFFP